MLMSNKSKIENKQYIKKDNNCKIQDRNRDREKIINTKKSKIKTTQRKR